MTTDRPAGRAGPATSEPTSSPRRDRSIRRLLLTLALVAAGLAGREVVMGALAGLSDPRWVPLRAVDLTEPALEESVPEVAEDTSEARLILAVAPVISPERSVPLYDGLLRYLAAKSGRTPVLLQTTDYEDAYQILRRRDCDLAFVCTYTFVLGEQAFGMQLLAAPVVRGHRSYQSFLVVPSHRAVDSLLDLKGRRLASADSQSWTGWISSAVWLIERGEDPVRFFREHLVAGSHDRALRAVLAGLADGAAVDSLVYEEMVHKEPGLGRRLKVVARSAEFGMPPLVVHPQLDPGLRDQLRAALLAAHEDPDGRTALASLGIDRFLVPESSEYDDVRHGMRVWEGRR